MWERTRFLNKSYHFQLAVCTSAEKEASFANIKHIVAHLQAMKKSAHGVTRKTELKRCASHSIRVGACVFSGEGDHDGTLIKIRLH